MKLFNAIALICAFGFSTVQSGKIFDKNDLSAIQIDNLKNVISSIDKLKSNPGNPALDKIIADNNKNQNGMNFDKTFSADVLGSREVTAEFAEAFDNAVSVIADLQKSGATFVAMSFMLVFAGLLL